MASSAGSAAGKGNKHPRVLLPFTCNSLRIPDEIAEGIGAAEAVVVGPTSGDWRVEVGLDGDGAFLGRGWPEFADACGAGARWYLVLRHRGGGVLTVKAFDASNCLRIRELDTPVPPPAAAVEATAGSKDAARKPQFIRVLAKDFMEKLLIPTKFVQQYIPNEHLDNRTAIVLGPHGKVSLIGLERNWSDVFFAGGWPQFLVFHNITEADALLLTYEGSMVFTVKVFDDDGYQRETKHKETRGQQVSTSLDIEEQQQEAPSVSIQKHWKNNCPSSDGIKKPKGPMTPSNEEPLWMKPVYEIGAQSSIKKQINENTLKELSLAKPFCDAIPLHGPCTITLKTPMTSTKSWQVRALPCKSMSYRLGLGWRRFCLENSLKLGDICTITVIKPTLWHVVATRCEETINHLSYETPSTSSRMHNTMESKSSNKGQNGPEGSITSFSKASPKECVFDTLSPAWIKKEINSTTFEKALYLPPVFCNEIGIREPCKVTLKTSMSSTKSWQARVNPYKGSSHHVSGPGWTQFCRDNRIKLGDVCTINVFKPTLWQVIINSPE